MKSTILVALLMLVPFLLFSQDNEYQDFYDGAYIIPESVRKPRTKSFQLSEVVRNYELDKLSPEQLELEFMRYCNYKYYKQRRMAYGFSVAGIGLATAGAFLDPLENPNEQIISFAGGGALVLAGLVTFIDSDKWLRYSSIKPSRNGIGVVITF